MEEFPPRAIVAVQIASSPWMNVSRKNILFSGSSHNRGPFHLAPSRLL